MLLGAAIGTMLGLLFIPYRRGYGYLPIFNGFTNESITNVDINLPQLVVNVAFAALVGALVANLSKRGICILTICLAFTGIGIGVWMFSKIRAGAPDRARHDEAYANELATPRACACARSAALPKLLTPSASS